MTDMTEATRTNHPAVELLAGLTLEDGRTWGSVATPGQWADAVAVITGQDPDPRRHYWLRGRGMSKTSDAAAVSLVLLLTEAPAGSRSHAYAVDGEQAAIMADTLAGLVNRSGLGAYVEVGARTITVRSSGATLTVESSDGASAYGTRPWLTIADELGAWPSTANHRRLWSAIVSAVPKVPGSRLLVIGTAGSPTGLGAEVWANAEQSPSWRTARRPGPAPWWSPEDVESLRASLTPSEWRRLILCEWAESDDALGTADDVTACTRAGSSVLPYRPASGPYVAALDVGTRRDLTALAVGHAEHRDTGRVIVIDRVLSWRPDRTTADANGTGPGGRVDLGEVETAALRLCREYRTARLRFDRMQAEQLTTNLGRAGVRTSEFVFSTAGANRLARSLYVALRDHAVELPDDPELITELSSVRLVETGPGTVKMINPPGTHDDVAVAVGMVIADLTEQPDVGRGSIGLPHLLAAPKINRTNRDGHPSPSARLAAKQARRKGPRGVNWIGVSGSANDPASKSADADPTSMRKVWKRRPGR